MALHQLQLRDIRPSVRNAHPYRFHGTSHEMRRFGYRYALHLFVEGKGGVTIGDRSYTAEKNDLFFIPPGTPHSFRNDDAAPLFSYNVYFDLWGKRAAEDKHFAYGFEAFEPHLQTGAEPCPELDSADAKTDLQPFPRLAEDLIHVVRVSEGSALYKQDIANSLLYGWLLQWRHLTKASFGGTDYRIRRMVDQAVAAERVPVYEEWLEDSGLQKSQFHAVFKQTTGLSPQQYLVRLRMKKAKVLLLESNRSVTSVAEELGYPSIHYFSRQFAALFGVSPTAYRNRQYADDGVNP